MTILQKLFLQISRSFFIFLVSSHVPDHRWAHALSQRGFEPTTSARIASQTTGLDTLPETLRLDIKGASILHEA